ncbi:MAG TPA: LysE family transporter [Candidatus Kapabacteria bacterium]|nr:LysE family transporter [Candidatus Kapabacteria bacterium]
MFTALFIGAIIGFVLAMPPGPIGVASIRLGLESGRRATFQLSVGTAILDTIYCLIAIFAASAVQSTLNDFFASYPLISTVFQISVVSGLIVYGIQQFREREKNQLTDEQSLNTPEYLNNLKSKGPFLLGIALALTNIANPTFLPSLAVMSTWVQKMNLFDATAFHFIIFSLGFGIGNFLWLYTLGLIVHKNKHRLSNTSIHKIRQVAGLTFIGFGSWIGLRLVMLTNWANIFKIIFSF